MCYDLAEKGYKSKIEIRLKGMRGLREVEFYDGIRVSIDTIPSGKHMYHTRHSESDWSTPISIAPEGRPIMVNFCGTIVTDVPFDIKEETDVKDVNWI